jgi:hypothetical protein
MRQYGSCKRLTEYEDYGPRGIGKRETPVEKEKLDSKEEPKSYSMFCQPGRKTDLHIQGSCPEPKKTAGYYRPYGRGQDGWNALIAKFDTDHISPHEQTVRNKE